MLTGRSWRVAVAGALVCVGAGGLVAWPGDAYACSPNYQVVEAWPAGGELPANAFAVFVGYNLRENANFFTVLVGGEEVDFVVSQQLSGASARFSQLALRPLVPPAIGESWSVQFKADGPVKNVGTYTVAAADETPPAAPPASLRFDVHDFPFAECSSCGAADVNYWPHLGEDGEDGGAPLVHALYLGHPDADDDTLIAVSRVGAQLPFHQPLSSDWFADDQPVTEGVCFTLRLLDLAGNEAASALRTCKPCHALIDPLQDTCDGFEPNEEPLWTDADLVPGGACKAESAPSLPPEVFPEPGGDTDTGGSSGTGDPGTSTTGEPGTTTTSTMTGDPGTSTSTSGEPGTTTGTPTSGDPSPGGTSGSSLTTSDAMTTSGDSGGESSGSAGEAEDKAGCGCRSAGSASSLWLLLGLAGLRRRSRRA